MELPGINLPVVFGRAFASSVHAYGMLVSLLLWVPLVYLFLNIVIAFFHSKSFYIRIALMIAFINHLLVFFCIQLHFAHLYLVDFFMIAVFFLELVFIVTLLSFGLSPPYGAILIRKGLFCPAQIAVAAFVIAIYSVLCDPSVENGSILANIYYW